MITIGVLALQGDVREHTHMLELSGANVRIVRRPAELLAVDGLVVPGGESTTMIKLATAFDLIEPLRKHVSEGLPTLGTCAGMIMLADQIVDGIEGQETIGGIDMVVRRNAFGRQVDSFEADLAVQSFDVPFHAVFIRAPWVERIGPAVEPLARISTRHPEDGDAGSEVSAPGHTAPGATPDPGSIVAVRQDRLVATSFHPELTGDTRFHDYFVRLVKEA